MLRFQYVAVAYVTRYQRGRRNSTHAMPIRRSRPLVMKLWIASATSDELVYTEA